MQLSVLPHLTIYGDVKPEQLHKPLLTHIKETILKLPQREATEVMVKPEDSKITAQRKEMLDLVE